MSFGFSLEERGGARIVRLRGELDLATADKFADRLSNLEDSAIVIDLSGLSFIDSSGISVLIREHNRRGELVLTRPRPNVGQVLRIAGLEGWVRRWPPTRSPDPVAGTDAPGEQAYRRMTGT
jgi:anti-sigma B factor antagonist